MGLLPEYGADQLITAERLSISITCTLSGLFGGSNKFL